MMKLHWRQVLEQIYPYLWAVLAAFVVYRYGPALHLHLTHTQISTTTTIASILMGFLGTSYGILLSANSKRIEWAKGRRLVWKAILRFFNESFIANFALCIYSIFLAFFIDHPAAEPYQAVALIIWALLAMLSIISFYRAMRVLLGLLRPDA